MKNKFGLYGVLAAVLLSPLLIAGCPDAEQIKGKNALLIYLDVAGEADARVTFDLADGGAISESSYLAWVNGGTLAPNLTGILTIAIPEETAPASYTGTVDALVSANATATLSGSVAANVKPNDFAHSNGAELALKNGEYLYVKVASEDGVTKNYYRFLVTITSDIWSAGTPFISRHPRDQTRIQMFLGGTSGGVLLDKVEDPLEVIVTIPPTLARAGDTITYQWHRVFPASIDRPELVDEELEGETEAALSINGHIVLTDNATDVGDHYFYVVVTNTNENATIDKIAKSVSATAIFTLIGWTPEIPAYEDDYLWAPQEGRTYEVQAGVDPEDDDSFEPLVLTVYQWLKGYVTYQWYRAESDDPNDPGEEVTAGRQENAEPSFAEGPGAGQYPGTNQEVKYWPPTDVSSEYYYWVKVTHFDAEAPGAFDTVFSVTNRVRYEIIVP